MAGVSTAALICDTGALLDYLLKARQITSVSAMPSIMVMKTVGIADLKARLSEHLKSVRKGRSLTVLDLTIRAPLLPHRVLGFHGRDEIL